MSLSLLSRYAFFAACVIFTLASLPFLEHDWLWPFALVTGLLSLLGIFDLLQSPHAVRRNYPILGNIRYLVEGIRPEIRQYLLESDSDALPFSRAQRSLVYSRAKNESADKPFGTLIDVYQSGFEFIGHSMRPAPLSDPNSFRVTVGGPQCTQPYSASVFNISAMSFGSLSANAIRALNQGAKLGNFAHDTGEGSISPYHREHGGDLTWELGSGYFGCRTSDGRFDPERFAVQAQTPPGADDRDQDEPGRQAWPRRHPAQAQGDPGNRRHPGHPHGRGLHFTVEPQRLFHPDRDDAFHPATA